MKTKSQIETPHVVSYIFDGLLGRARHSVRAALRIYEFGGQPPSRRSGALARREGGRTARPTFYPCPLVFIRGLLS